MSPSSPYQHGNEADVRVLIQIIHVTLEGEYDPLVVSRAEQGKLTAIARRTQITLHRSGRRYALVELSL